MPNEVFKSAKAYFGHIKGSKPPKQAHIIESIQEPIQKEIYIQKASEVQMMAIGFKTPDFTHQDQLPLEVLSTILTGGKSSRLYQRLVDKKTLSLYHL